MAVVWNVWACLLYSVIIPGTGRASMEFEYLIDLNVNLISTQVKEEAFVSKLKEEYRVTLIQTLHGGSIKMLHVSASKEGAEAVSDLGEVNLVEKNGKAQLTYVLPQFPMFCHEVAAPETWGLDRIDQRSQLTSNDPKNKLATFVHGPHRGAGVAAYIVDTGIDINHPAFGNRAIWGYTVPGMGENIDGYGHGTHVAGTVGAAFYGVATEAILIAVKVFNDKGEDSSWPIVISGLKWVLNHHNRRKSGGNMPKSVLNLSLSGDISECMDKWVRELIHAGITVVASAGNNNRDACIKSPARVKEAITVAASDVTDTTSFFSNWGCCVDLYAPGDWVKSTMPIKLGSTGFKRGTSMATPHVTGVIALKLSKDTDVKTPAKMTDWVLNISTKNKLHFYNSNHAKSPNRLLYINCTLCDDLSETPHYNDYNI